MYFIKIYQKLRILYFTKIENDFDNKISFFCKTVSILYLPFSFLLDDLVDFRKLKRKLVYRRVNVPLLNCMLHKTKINTYEIMVLLYNFLFTFMKICIEMHLFISCVCMKMLQHYLKVIKNISI